MNTTNRRQFVHAATLGTAGLWITQTGCVSTQRNTAGKRVAFNTANLVARFTDYRFELKRWGEQHQKTVALTDEAAWAAICREIADAGFSAVEIWEAHAAPETLNREKAARWKRIHGRASTFVQTRFRTMNRLCLFVVPASAGSLAGRTSEGERAG